MRRQYELRPTDGIAAERKMRGKGNGNFGNGRSVNVLPVGWFPFCLVVFSAMLLGLSKTGIPGVAVFAVVLMAFGFHGDAKYSVGVILPILIFCDFFAVTWLRRDVEWRRLWKLFPFVAIGIFVAWWTMDRLSNTTFKVGLGVLILVLLALEWLRRRLAMDRIPHQWWFTGFMGVLGGFSSTIANAGGPVMTVYLLSCGLDKRHFMGTCAWFFFLLNLSKILPSWDLGLINRTTLTLNLWMIPPALVGVFLGMWLLPRIHPQRFEQIVSVLTAISAVMLIAA